MYIIDSGIEEEPVVVSQAAQPQSKNEGLPVPGPIGKKRSSLAGVGAGVREVDAGQPVPVVYCKDLE